MSLLGTLVNKFEKIAGWNSIKVVMLGRQVEGITTLPYKNSKEKEDVCGAEEFPVGCGEGNYRAETSVTLPKEEINVLQLTLGTGRRLTDIKPSGIPVMYEYKGLAMKDAIRSVESMDSDVDVKQGDKSIATQLTLFPSHINWSVAM